MTTSLDGQRIGSDSSSTSNPTTKISESLERTLGDEPGSSTIRTALLAGAGLSILASLALQSTGRKHEALFVGQWPPTLIAIALWFQITKQQQRTAPV